MDYMERISETTFFWLGIMIVYKLYIFDLSLFVRKDDSANIELLNHEQKI